MIKKNLPEIILRLISGTIYIAVLISLIVLNNTYLVISIVGLASLFFIWEYFNCVDLKLSPHMILGFIISLATTAALLIFQDISFKYFSIAIALIFIITIILGILFSKKHSFNSIPITIFGYLYSVYLPIFLVKIYFLKQGNIKLALLFIIAIATDTFAFLIGKKFGKHKLIKISPNKSIEGSISGVIAAIVFSLLYAFIVNNYYNFNLNLNYFIVVGFAIILSVFAQLGDLTASYIKRAFNKKDFGNILAGQGGLLDRMDSLIFIAPIGYLIIRFLI